MKNMTDELELIKLEIFDVKKTLSQKADLERGMRLGATKYLIKATAGLDEIVAEAAKVLSS